MSKSFGGAGLDMKSLAFKVFSHAVMLALLAAYAAGQAGAIQQQPLPEPTPDPAAGVGTINGSTYKNEYFGMELKIPTGWTIYDAQGRQILLEDGKQRIATDDKKVQAALDAGVARTVTLLTFTKLPQNQSGSDNAVLACGAELVPRSVIKTGSDYLTEMEKLLKYAKDPYTVEEDVRSETINGTDFGVLNLKLEISGTTIRQKYYAIAKRDFAVFCISTFVNDADRQVMSAAMNSIKFR